MLALLILITYGEVNAEYVAAYDGDTITVNIPSYPPIIGQRVKVRLARINAPEMDDPNPIQLERARAAKQRLVSLVKNKPILLQNMKRDKYFRILAEVVVDGVNASDLLLKDGLVDPYPKPKVIKELDPFDLFTLSK